MALLTPPTAEQLLALRTLLATASNVSKAVLEFEKWLVAGYSAILVTALPKYAELIVVIEATPLRIALSFLAVALVLSVPVLFMGSQLAASAATADEVRKEVPALTEDLKRPVDLDALHAEQAKALWWPGSWGHRWGNARVLRGDWVAPGRLLAKLSQLQVYLVMLQLVFGLIALACAIGGLIL